MASSLETMLLDKRICLRMKKIKNYLNINSNLELSAEPENTKYVI